VLTPESRAIEFGTAATFNFPALIKERSNHETEESKSAITYRYQHAMGTEELVDVVSKAVDVNKPAGASAPDSPHDDDPTSTTKLKASMVNEITRIMSAALTTTAKLDTAGIERLARWRNAGIITDNLSNMAAPSNTSSSTGLARSALQAREVYKPLAQRLSGFPFVNGGLSALHPLKCGSWVLVGFQNQVWLGNG
jgi:hypothetical protein